MIQNPFANLTPVVKNLVIINVIFYIATFVFAQTHLFDMQQWLAAYYPDSPNFKLWQIITYMFMHSDQTIFHIIFNMIGLVSFGPILEQTMGSKRFLSFYFICGIGALLCQALVQGFEVQAITGHFFNPDITLATLKLDETYIKYGMDKGVKLYQIYNGGLVGASGAVFGVLTAFGLLYPNLELMIIPIPVPVKAKFIIPAYIVFELVMGFGQFAGDSVAHFAHLGGAIVGFIVIKAWRIERPHNFF